MPKSNTPQVKIVNVQTGEEIIRDMNAEELVEYEANAAAQFAADTAAAQKSADRAALLAQLGITEEQAKLLLA
jgi:hypothetical protein